MSNNLKYCTYAFEVASTSLIRGLVFSKVYFILQTLAVCVNHNTFIYHFIDKQSKLLVVLQDTFLAQVALSDILQALLENVQDVRNNALIVLFMGPKEDSDFLVDFADEHELIQIKNVDY